MSFSRMIKLANKIEKKYLISFADGDKIHSASISCEPDYETEYYIYLTVSGSVNGANFDECLGIYITGAQTFDSIDDLARRLDDYLNNYLRERNMISYEQIDSLSLMNDYLNNLSFEKQNSWLQEVNTMAKRQSDSWKRERSI